MKARIMKAKIAKRPAARRAAFVPVAIALLGLSLPIASFAQDSDLPRWRTTLSGSAEVPTISTRGNGRLHTYLASDGLHYELVYRDLEGGDVAQAHIHLGQQHTNGGPIVFLCSNMAGAPAGVPACPASPGRVIGVLSSMDVVGPTAQGIAAGEFAEFLRALGNGTAYANVHTETYPNGEIRGQLRRFVP